MTARAKPAPTVTKTVKVTLAPAAADDSSKGEAFSDDSNSDSGSTPTYYVNCSAVRAAGAAPIHRGEPGYASHLDRDGDGIACDT